MSNAVFPHFLGLKWGVKKTPVWSTKIQTSANGRELRAAYYSYPLWRFTLEFEVLRTKGSLNELEALAGFFNARQGCFDSFLYDDPTDNKVVEQLVGTIQAGQMRYQLIRNFGGFIEPIIAPKENTVIKVNGVIKQRGVDYMIDQNGGLLFQTPQTIRHSITWSGGFYFRVRFMHDSADFENVLVNLWAAKKIEFQSIKL